MGRQVCLTMPVETSVRQLITIWLHGYPWCCLTSIMEPSQSYCNSLPNAGIDLCPQDKKLVLPFKSCWFFIRTMIASCHHRKIWQVITKRIDVKKD